MIGALEFFFATLGLAYLLVGLGLWAVSVAFGDVSDQPALDHLKWFAACTLGWFFVVLLRRSKW